jgi:adenylylsulfate kinase
MIFQFTGLSGAGKTSIAQALKTKLESQGLRTEVIDGDQYRQTICKGLGFSKEDRCENIRRLGKVAESFRNQNCIAIISAINPYEVVRQELKETYGAKTIWVNCEVDVLIDRDTKGLYKRALLPNDHPDKINNLTGINDTYEIPHNADLVLYTSRETLEESTEKVFAFICNFLQR